MPAAPANTAPRYFRIPATAERYGVSTKTIRRMVSRGELRAFRFGSRLILIDINEADARLRRIPAADSSAPPGDRAAGPQHPAKHVRRDGESVAPHGGDAR